MKYLTVFILVFSVKFMFCQKDTLLSTAFLKEKTEKMEFIDNPSFNNFFFITDSETGLMDYEFNLKYIGKIKNIENT